jgi:hypothetical protein
VTRIEVVERARSVIGMKCKYALGKGGFYPENPVPWNSRKECDCTGFAAWVYGVSRKTDNPWYVKQNGGWFETSAIYRDATCEYGFVEQVLGDPQPGDLIVYPDSGGEQGHIGIVSRVEEGAVIAVVHCSSSSYRREGDAIQETPPGLFLRSGALVAKVAWMED